MFRRSGVQVFRCWERVFPLRSRLTLAATMNRYVSALGLALVVGGPHTVPAARAGAADLNAALIRALTGRDLPRVKQLVSAGADVNTFSDPASLGGKRTALMLAAEKGDVTFVNDLLRRGAKVDARGVFEVQVPPRGPRFARNVTALMLAARGPGAGGRCAHQRRGRSEGC